MDTSRIITLTTDFGSADTFVGQMKGAALAIDPDVRVVDLCHEVPAQDVRSGAYLIETGYAAFPDGTVHVVVVDPGVGTERRIVAVQAGGHYFLAPDNGVLTRVLRRERMIAAHAIQQENLFGPRRSKTFAGRDVFAPVAAWLCRGVGLDRVGPPAPDLTMLECGTERIELGRPSRVLVLHVDHFGNVVLDVRVETLTAVLGHPPDERSTLRLAAEEGLVTRFHATYAEAEGAEPFFLINSTGYLEVAVNSGRADVALGLRAGLHPELRIG